MTTWWALTFAWLPVYVDAYDPGELNGKFRAGVWLRPVWYRHEIWIDDDDARTPIYRIRYRLPVGAKP